MLVPSAAEELRTLRLRDRRLEERARKIVGRLEVSPDVGFPQALKEEAEVEAFYRFTANHRVEADDLIDAHARERVGPSECIRLELSRGSRHHRACLPRRE